MKQGLLKKISQLGKELPLNTLDELIDKFGGPEKVSEVRGEGRSPFAVVTGDHRYDRM